ncbi:MAG: F0F1 ATP synthase subunit epsilon [Muribaculaceae bacterium]|nr:F0F1 ATP synthase subunit epsilon [Muribaculaceae bacterium]
MTLNIISAEKVEFTGEVTKVTLPGAQGLFTVLENHAALISSLVAGRIVYTADDKDVTMEIKGGIADVNHNVVSVCLY